MGTITFNDLLEKYRKYAFSERDKGDKFERLMQGFLKTDPTYEPKFNKVWLWNEFPGKKDFGGKDTGIDLVALTHGGDYWAIQCKCFQEDAVMDKGAVDSFLSTSSREFLNEEMQTTRFTNRLWVSTTNHWGGNATEAIKNQHPPVSSIGLSYLRDSPVDWAKLEKGLVGNEGRSAKKTIYPHVYEVMEATHAYFKEHDRGKLIMACGTGKTITSLKVAEKETDGKGLILFLVPSIALLGQTLREWSAQANEPINAVCICSDAEVSKAPDSDTTNTSNLALPASTDVKNIVRQFAHIAKNPKQGMTVVFSTYQSIEVIARAQKGLMEAGVKPFDLIICDEAHRTTGVSLAGEDESAFVKVHDNTFIQAKKRLYMTATPRLYSAEAKSQAAQADAAICSMDEPKDYGEEIYRIGFGEAVKRGMLTDYKVLILTLNEMDVPPAVQRMIEDKDHDINTDDASKLIGCLNALSKQVLGDAGIIKATDPEPMRRAVAFCQSIKVSKQITGVFNGTADTYISSLPKHKQKHMVSLSSKHVDGTMSAPVRDELLSWLKEDTNNSNECRMLTNVRCLSEGVDVPSLDAVLFLSARNSQVDVVQSVGRVMRKSPGKKYGYIIIPVIVPSDVDAEKALDNNERYKVVWTVLNALRAHDDRFNATVNKLDLNQKKPDNILVGRPDTVFENGMAISVAEPQAEYATPSALGQQLAVQFEQLQGVVFARMVEKVGDRKYWEQWAKDVAQIAERQVERINRLIAEDEVHQQAFAQFLEGLRQNINPSITQQEAVDMLSQHIITRPVFEALFEGYSFVKHNAISQSMQHMLDLLEDKAFDKDATTLQKFYESVRERASGIDNNAGRQKIIIELYDKFFKTAFPKMVEKLGIVYTPVEVVDFIIHSVNDVLNKEFDRSLSDENVHILDPFTGTGTFITRLLQSGLIAEKDLERKYKHELHANEIVLLAYYIAAINIENAYHDATPDPNDGLGTQNFTPFDGIVLTDTFQLGETDASERLITEMFPQNSERVTRQKKAPLRVIIGNPPYSVGQKSANDNAQNQKYERLDSRIEATYAHGSTATSVKALYDAYIKAFRWSTDRLDKDGGIIAFVSNSGWLDGGGMDGLRKSFEKEFSSIYVFNLRGNARTQGELRQKESGNVFGSGSRTPIAITLLVKHPKAKQEKATIHYHDIGDYLTREQKLDIIKKANSISNLDWKQLTPNVEGDWVNERNDAFATFLPMAPEKKFEPKSVSYFLTYSLGLASGRDAWVYSFSENTIKENVGRSIDFFNQQSESFKIARNENQNLSVEDFVDADSKKISWNRNLKQDLEANKKHQFNVDGVVTAHLRPFVKSKLYFDKDMNAMLYQNKKLFPTPSHKNLVICVSGASVLMADTIPDLHFNGDTQAFPLYWFEEVKRTSATLFDGAIAGTEYVRRDGVSDWILGEARKRYGTTVGKEDIFYYVYGFLHSPHYREKFSNDLKKMLPRLPLVETVKDFWAFSKAGRKLAELHVGYEQVPPCEAVTVTGAEKLSFLDKEPADTKLYLVEKMRFPKKGQKDTIIYNSRISISNIPAEAYDYVVNGKSAIEWVMERYAITTHKESGIRNDPNDWAQEVGNPRYILDLLLSVIEVSVRSVEIVEGLPEVGFEN